METPTRIPLTSRVLDPSSAKSAILTVSVTNLASLKFTLGIDGKVFDLGTTQEMRILWGQFIKDLGTLVEYEADRINRPNRRG